MQSELSGGLRYRSAGGWGEDSLTWVAVLLMKLQLLTFASVLLHRSTAPPRCDLTKEKG